MNRHGKSRHFRAVENIVFHILPVASDCLNQADAYSDKTFRCNQKYRCGLLLAFQSLEKAFRNRVIVTVTTTAHAAFRTL